jgi:anhydro-N-acetylmuramic acid kinase
LLFGDYAACLNIGGIVNVSMNRLGKRVAWDITIANMALNWIAMQCGLPYDKDGALAAAGKINFDLLKKLEDLPFHQKQSPKSLGREWFEQEVVPLLCGETPENLSTTVCELIARQTATALAGFDEKSSVLVTGGGAHHAYLTSRIEEHCACRIVIPEHNLVDFKEALVFAFLGALYMFGQPNVLKDSTGSQRDHVGGALYRGI